MARARREERVGGERRAALAGEQLVGERRHALVTIAIEGLARPRQALAGDGGQAPAPVQPRRDGGHAPRAGTCWVMQCGPPPPKAMTPPGTPTTSRPG